MNIAVLSGKGGTGKTTVSTNLALALNSNYIDCDVEEPNGFLFLKPEIYHTERVETEYPVIDKQRCVSCGACVEVCQFNALANVNNNIMLFEKLCHGCGACKIACNYEALTYDKREIGKIENGEAYGIKCKRGILNIGEPMAVPVIRQLLQNLPHEKNIIDCPPGTSCNVVNSLRYADSAILVTEPTKFGLHDLKVAVELVKMFKIPFGIIINKDDGKENEIREYCKEENIDIIGSIPYKKDIAKEYSKGEILYHNPYYSSMFDKLANNVEGVFRWN
ncbi:ATP-binding protein [Proteiniborus sp.]|uniref:ATP-binding protein n=1 Tax=Proteiniborus sp. TaxID=2079015 RepID=UPI00332F25A8